MAKFPTPRPCFDCREAGHRGTACPEFASCYLVRKECAELCGLVDRDRDYAKEFFSVVYPPRPDFYSFVQRVRKQISEDGCRFRYAKDGDDDVILVYSDLEHLKSGCRRVKISYRSLCESGISTELFDGDRWSEGEADGYEMIISPKEATEYINSGKLPDLEVLKDRAIYDD